jgi:hypothetical protein
MPYCIGHANNAGAEGVGTITGLVPKRSGYAAHWINTEEFLK